MPLRVLPMLFLMSFSAGACGLVEPQGAVEVRVSNGSAFVLDYGILHLPGDTLLFQGLQPGQATPYKEVGKAYRIAGAQVITAQDTARLQPIDFVGEEPLAPGRYTYVLSFHDNLTTNLVMTLEKSP